MLQRALAGELLLDHEVLPGHWPDAEIAKQPDEEKERHQIERAVFDEILLARRAPAAFRAILRSARVRTVVFAFNACADRRSPQGPPPENEWLLRAHHLDRNRRMGEFRGAAPQVMGLWRRAPRKPPCIVE
jgi:hypothetical protein